MSKTLIVTGGSINVAWAKEWLDNQTFDYCIAADSGLEYADKLGLKVDFLLGDYDSVDKDVLDRYKSNTEFEIYPKEKDYTDTHLAIMTALKKGATDIYILGATGTRMDHTITNIGNISVREEYESYIEGFHAYLAMSKGQNLKGTICSYKDTLVFTFSFILKDTSVQKAFFRKLASDGLDVSIESNGVCYE